jgi:hypothetical protein
VVYERGSDSRTKPKNLMNSHERRAACVHSARSTPRPVVSPVTLLRTDRHQVDYFPNGGKITAFIFSHWASQPQPREGFGFGGELLLETGFDVVAFKAVHNDWFSCITEDQVRSIGASVPAGVRVGYGTSMGGYAALRFSGLLGMTRVLAISPQFDIRQPWDRRYEREAALKDFQPINVLCTACCYFVAFDPLNQDALHVRALEELGSIERIHVWRAGHPASFYLADVGAIRQFVLSILLHGQVLDLRPFRRFRRKSRHYLLSVALLAARRNRLTLAISVINEALALQPEDQTIQRARQWLLSRARSSANLEGQPEEIPKSTVETYYAAPTARNDSPGRSV